MSVRSITTAGAATVAAATLLASVTLAPAASAQPGDDVFGNLTGSLGGPVPCDIDLQQIADSTPHPLEGSHWKVGDHNDLGSNLGYLFLKTASGTASSPTTVFLFHHCAKTPTQPPAEDNQTQQILGSSSPFHVSLGVMHSELSGGTTATAPHLYTVYVWNPLAGDVIPIDLPEGVQV